MRRTARLGLLALATWLLVVQQPAVAQGFSQIAFATFTANVTLTTTTEMSVVSSGPALAPRQTVNVCVYAWAQLTTGAATTTVTPRIRRGTTTSGTLVGEANAITIGAAAGSTEQYVAMVCEDRANVGSVDYNFSLAQASATGDGTALQGGILVLVR